MKARIIMALFCIAISMTACGGSAEPEAVEEAVEETVEEEPEVVEEVVEEEPFTAPDGETLYFEDSVRNDTTGNWRLTKTTSSTPTSDYAYDYYKNMFQSDDEVHAVINFTLNTTTSISCMSGVIFVDSYEYVDGEEHDAALLFTGQHLGSVTLNAETGEEMVFE